LLEKKLLSLLIVEKVEITKRVLTTSMPFIVMHAIPGDSENYEQIPNELDELFEKARSTEPIIPDSSYTEDLKDGQYIIYNNEDSSPGETPYMLIGESNGDKILIEEYMMLFNMQKLTLENEGGRFIARQASPNESDLKELLEEREPGADLIQLEDKVANWRNSDYYQDNNLSAQNEL
jgi:hypothetical protein